MRRLTMLSGAIVAGLALVACGTAGRVEPAVDVAAVETSPPVTDPASGPLADIRVTSEADANLHLWVSNQSFVDDTVHVSVSIDDVDVLSSPFAVEDQHNWVLYPISAPAGPHV